MEPADDRAARRRREIEQELSRSAPRPPAAARGFGRSLSFLTATLLTAIVLFGLAVTLGRLSGGDMADAARTGQAAVRSCTERGPITNRGFGFSYSCDVSVTWAGGATERLTIGAVFTPDDIGRDVTVGDLGTHRSRRQLARADAAAKPVLEWLGYAVGAIALIPAFIGVLLVPGLWRSRR